MTAGGQYGYKIPPQSIHEDEMQLVPSRCSRHPLIEMPCGRCQVLATLWRKSEAEQERIRSIVAFGDLHPASTLLHEAESVLQYLQTDDYSIQKAVRLLNEKVWRLAGYPDMSDRRVLAAQARDFLQTLLES